MLDDMQSTNGGTMIENRPTLVLGATGKTGSRVLERLTARGVPVRAGSRSGTPPFDWEDRSTWAPVLEGMEAVYLWYYPDIAVPGAREPLRSFTELAVASGATRVVLLAGRGEPEADFAEQAVRDSGADWTILRPAWFDQNFNEGAFVDQIMAGELATPAGDVKEPFIDVDDIADVAVAALTDDRHIGQVYELTGPRLLTIAEAVQEIARAASREIRYVPISVDEYTSMLTEYGLPADFVWLLRYLFTEVLDGRNAHLADGVQRALGRPPRDFADFARDAASTGVWSGSPVAG
jgi:uncharacterized protein YbjT (DUF2867 family)